MNRSEPFKYFYRKLPFRSQIKFYGAVFFTFAPIWAVAVSRLAADRSWLEVLSYFVSSGIIASGYAFAFTRDRKYLAVVVPLQILLGISLGALWGEPPTTFTLTGLAAILSIVAGYILFVNFIQDEGTKSLRLQTEIGLARQLHDHLVPPVVISLPWIDVRGLSLSSGEVGGDLIDALVRDEALGLFVADVSGHGVKAAVMMSMVKSALHMKLLQSKPDDDLCDDLNRVVYRMKRPEMFVTFAFLTVGRDRTVRHVNAGHPPILHYRRDSGAIDELPGQKPALGLIEDFSYPVRSLTASPGDLFLLVTDGLFEVADRSGSELGLDAIKKVLLDHRDASLEKLVEEILARVRAHGRQEDDQALVIARVH